MLDEVVGHETDEDLYPSTEGKHSKLVAQIEDEFQSAQTGSKGHHDRFDRYYRHYRSYRGTRKAGDWRSRLFLPVTFYVIETIVPRMVQQMPEPVVNPVGPEDVDGARRMEWALKWCFDQSDAFIQVMLGFKDALMYGTGILKTFHGEKRRRRFVYERPMVPIMQSVPMPVPDPENGGRPMVGLDGEPMTELIEMMMGMQQGPPVRRWEDAISYSGPATQVIDPKNFFPAPGATSMEDAPYVIERAWKSREWVQKQVQNGTYRLPEGTSPQEFWDQLDDPAHDRLTQVGLDGGLGADQSRKMVEIWERWHEDGTTTHVLGGRVVARVARNPFSHGEMPYARIVDHLVPHEFWGIGEIEPIEGLQDAINALTNGRIDQVKMALLAPFLVDEAALADRRELQLRPGALVRVKNNWGLPLENIIQKVQFGDVPSSSFEETALIRDEIERVTGVSGYQTGTDSGGRMNDTATGVAIISEQGNTRFSHKLKVAELTGLRTLSRHFGTNLQQFMPEEMRVRVFNEGTQPPSALRPDELEAMSQVATGGSFFANLKPEEIQGAFDYDIESESSAQTESVRKDQDLTLYNMFAGDPSVNGRWLRERVLRTFGVKDIDEALTPEVPQGLGGMGIPGLEGLLPPAAPPLEGAPV